MELLDILSSLMALIILEIVLGIDNLIILSILTEKLPPERRKQARKVGLLLAWFCRLLLLGLAFVMVHLTKPILTVLSFSFSVRDFFLLLGGGFLIWKATEEIHQEVTEEPVFYEKETKAVKTYASYRRVVIQVALMDIVFSLDSVLTAVGLTSRFYVMALAISCAIWVMIYASEAVTRFISKHPTIKMLALSYLILIGMVLIADGFSFHVPRGYLYVAMGFSLSVEALNLIKRTKKKRQKE